VANREFKIIRGGRLLSADFRRAEAADILIKGNRFEAITAPGVEAPSDAELIDASDRLLMPGLINAHTHGHGSLAKGYGDRWTLELLLNAGPWITANRTLEHKYLSASLAAAEMISKGCTSAYDLYVEVPLPSIEGMQAVGCGYRDAGFRALMAPMVADRGFFETVPALVDALPAALQKRVRENRMAPGESSLKICRELIESWPFDRERIGIALGPTIPLHCSDDYLTAHRDLARELDVATHTHLGESKIQALSGVRSYGKTLTAHLEELGFLNPKFTAAHAVWLDPDDIRRLADNGCSVAHNPGSNMRLGSGFAPIREMLEAGVNVGIGTDGAHCADNQNMFESMRFASFVSRTRSHDYERWLETDEVFGLATRGSAHVLGLGDRLGKVAPGYLADLVMLDLNSINWIPVNDPANLLVHTEDGSAVDSVMVDGEMVYVNRQFVHLDVASLRAQAEEALTTLSAMNHESRLFCEQLERHVGHFCIGLAREPYHVHALAGEDF